MKKYSKRRNPMENKKLLEQSAHLGYPLLETQESFDVNKALADVVKSKNYRFYEGFPIMLANAAKNDSFDFKKVQSLLQNKTEKDLLKELFLLSLALYEFNGLRFSWLLPYVKDLSKEDREVVKSLKERCLVKGADFVLANYRFSYDRVKNTFHQYFVSESKEVKSFSDKRDELSLELAFSEVFPPKQKDLFLRKLKGEKLTKTEREYFSRTVKKRATALANNELHELAQKVLQN
jgi:hypothetical protein